MDRYHGGSPANAPKAGVYFETPRAPLVADLMPDIVRRGHARGMRVFAWMTSREITWDFPDKAECLEYHYDFASATVTRGRGLDVFHPAVEAYLAALYRDLARTGVDGVLLQDDLVLRHGVGLGPHAEAAFAARANLPLRPNLLYAKVEWTPAGRPRATYTDLFWTWSKMKSERILALVLRLRGAIREAHPRAEMAMNVYYDSVLMPRNGLAWLSQDIEAWAASPIESFAVMAYHRQMAEEMSLSFDDTVARLREMRQAMEGWVGGERRRILWKAQVRDWTTRAFVPNDEIARAMAALGAGGNVVFVPVEEDWDGLAEWRFGASR